MPGSPSESANGRLLDVLAVDGDASSWSRLPDCLPPDVTWRAVRSTTEAEEVLQNHRVKVLLCSDDLDGETGLMFLARTRDRWPMLQRILMAPHVDAELLIHAMREVSVFHYLPKPLEPESVRHMVEHSLRQFGLVERLMDAEQNLGEARILNARLSAPEHTVKRIVREGPRMLYLMAFPLLLLFVLLIVALSVVYFFKSLLGIDILSGHHLRDFFAW